MFFFASSVVRVIPFIPAKTLNCVIIRPPQSIAVASSKKQVIVVLTAENVCCVIFSGKLLDVRFSDALWVGVAHGLSAVSLKTLRILNPFGPERPGMYF
jgi:hypothetical protein